jgi:hypothetical protein
MPYTNEREWVLGRFGTSWAHASWAGITVTAATTPATVAHVDSVLLNPRALIAALLVPIHRQIKSKI